VPGSKERQRRRARERYERLRAERAARRRRILRRTGIGGAVVLVIGLAAGLAVAFTGGSSTGGSKPAAAPAARTATARCAYAKSASGAVKPVSLPPSSPDLKAAYTATINTNLGPVTISLANSRAPCTVNSFTHLASANFWNNTQCHRVSDSGGLYMLQCGDPTAAASQKLSCSSATVGTGGPGYTFDDENLKGATYPAGTVAMANSGPNTNGSQFFLVFAQTSLPASYTPFGTITSGLDILQNVAKAGTSCSYSAGGGVPKEKVLIESVDIRGT
jgi:peptidyl-prolyl cis-trans isomerase B (cyclophilin B)